MITALHAEFELQGAGTRLVLTEQAAYPDGHDTSDGAQRNVLVPLHVQASPVTSPCA